MAKKSKADQQNPTGSAGEKSKPGSAGNGVTGAEAKKSARKPRAPKKKKAEPQKERATGSNPFTGEASEREPSFEPSDEQIRLRAYFIAERRLQLLLPGDSSGDWIEARRQLLAENDQRES